jgi:hypothetical protein
MGEPHAAAAAAPARQRRRCCQCSARAQSLAAWPGAGMARQRRCQKQHCGQHAAPLSCESSKAAQLGAPTALTGGAGPPLALRAQAAAATTHPPPSALTPRKQPPAGWLHYHPRITTAICGPAGCAQASTQPARDRTPPQYQPCRGESKHTAALIACLHMRGLQPDFRAACTPPPFLTRPAVQRWPSPPPCKRSCLAPFGRTPVALPPPRPPYPPNEYINCESHRLRPCAWPRAHHPSQAAQRPQRPSWPLP